MTVLANSSIYFTTNFCKKALNLECPAEKRLICCKESHDFCLTGQYEEDIVEHQLFLVNQQKAQEKEKAHQLRLFELTIDPMCFSAREIFLLSK